MTFYGGERKTAVGASKGKSVRQDFDIQFWCVQRPQLVVAAEPAEPPRSSIHQQLEDFRRIVPASCQALSVACISTASVKKIESDVSFIHNRAVVARAWRRGGPSPQGMRRKGISIQ
jgi:hypothetical protein